MRLGRLPWDLRQGRGLLKADMARILKRALGQEHEQEQEKVQGQEQEQEQELELEQEQELELEQEQEQKLDEALFPLKADLEMALKAATDMEMKNSVQWSRVLKRSQDMDSETNRSRIRIVRRDDDQVRRIRVVKKKCCGRLFDGRLRILKEEQNDRIGDSRAAIVGK